MRKVCILFLILLSFSIGFSLDMNCTYVKYYVGNLTEAANEGKISFDVAVDALTNSAQAYGCSGNGILVIEGEEKYTYLINGSDIGTFLHKILLKPAGVYSIKAVYGSNSVNKTVNLSAGKVKIVSFKVTNTTASQSTSSSGGPLPNTFYKLDKDSILSYLGNFANELGLNKSEVEYQEKVYSIVPFETKYIRVSVGGGNSLYYYFKNNWNQSVNVTLVVVIPKNITSNLNGVAMVAGYKVVKEDPIVEWNYLVAPGKEVKVGYTIAKNITKVEPLIVLFHGIKLPETTEKSSKNLSNNEFWNKTTTEINESESNQTTKVISPKKNLKINLLFIAIPIVVSAIAFVSILLYKRRKAYNELEEALDKLDTILKTRRRR